ncbi:hypothetical protein ABZ632_23720 [Streptomyces albidoflavus]|uniref:hypothetical protein n=1 Tax=Streptomyces albidoflavus TaxID=1886 RepID=UPI00341108B3
MSASAALPLALLFLDVEGTLLPYGRTRPPADLREWAAWQHAGNPPPAEADRAHGPRLLALPCSPYGATAWTADANEVITGLDRAWVARHHRGPAPLHRVDPVTGLIAADFAVLGRWLRDPAAR